MCMYALQPSRHCIRPWAIGGGGVGASLGFGLRAMTAPLPWCPQGRGNGSLDPLQTLGPAPWGEPFVWLKVSNPNARARNPTPDFQQPRIPASCWVSG